MSDKLNIQSPKGMHDLLADEYILYQNVFDKAEEIASYYGFKPIQTPHLESAELFTATVGATSDIVEKQMYYVQSDGNGNLVLRPEGTAPGDESLHRARPAYASPAGYALVQGFLFPARKSSKRPVQRIFPIRLGNDRRG